MCVAQEFGETRQLAHHLDEHHMRRIGVLTLGGEHEPARILGNGVRRGLDARSILRAGAGDEEEGSEELHRGEALGIAFTV